MTGILYVVATPIGNLADISLRALETLSTVAVIAAEDTRRSRMLLNHHQIKLPKIVALHDHNESQKLSQILGYLAQGQSVALVSDAGTPLVNDPGYLLVCAARQRQFTVTPIPGPSSVTAALSVAGLPVQRFAFEGFLPPKAQARWELLQRLRYEPRTLVFLESCHRLTDSLQSLTDCFGERPMVLAKELTKRHEAIQQGSAQQLLIWLREDSLRLKGEFVLLITGSDESPPDDATRILQLLLAQLPRRQAVDLAAQITGKPRNLLYRQALASEKNPDQE